MLDVLQLDALIKVINKLVKNEEKRFGTGQPSSEIAHYHFERQGVIKVIEVIEGIRDGHIKMRDYLDDN